MNVKIGTNQTERQPREKKQWHPKNKGQYSSFTYDKELRCGEEINEGGKTRQPVELESYCHRGCSVIFKPFFRITFKLRIVLFKRILNN